jgi:hypothetical protein
VGLFGEKMEKSFETGIGIQQRAVQIDDERNIPLDLQQSTHLPVE